MSNRLISTPVILFAYARPDHLRRTLECLKENKVPLLYAFSDGAKSEDKETLVKQVRDMLRTIDWCEVRLCEREENLGLGRSILTGVTEVLDKHEAAIIVEDDLIFVPGTYEYLRIALDQYKDDDRVMSVTGWTHPLITPPDVTDKPYFDGRAECLVWGTWSRVWQGMGVNATILINQCVTQGIDIYRYGADLVDMAKVEQKQNIWAVRFLYLHILGKGLCLRPPWSMVEHIGSDALATNAKHGDKWVNSPLKPCPPLPIYWPEPEENTYCVSLHQREFGTRPSTYRRAYQFTRNLLLKVFALSRRS